MTALPLEDEQGRPLPSNLENHAITVDASHRTWFNGELLIDGSVAVEHVAQQEDNSYKLSCCLRKPLGGDEAHHETHTGVLLDYDTLERSPAVNAWLGKSANILGMFKDKHPARQAFKAWLFAQPRATERVRDISVFGYNPELDCFFGQDNLVDRSDLSPWLHPYVDALTSQGHQRLRRRSKGIHRGAPTLAVVYENKPDSEHNARVAWATAAQHMLDAWRDNLGDHTAAIAFGWYHAHVWRHALTTKDRNFPHLYITGRFQSGKDTMATLLNRAFGVAPNAVTSAGRTTTDKWVRNALSEVGNWPLWLNELRDSMNDFGHLCSVIRTSYDLQGSAVLDRQQHEIEFPNRRSLMLVGESILGADAERSRYLMLLVKPPRKPSRIVEVEHAADRCALAFPWLLQYRNIGTEMAHCYTHFMPVFREAGCDARRARTFGLAMAGLVHAFCVDLEKSEPLAIIPEPILEQAKSMAQANMDTSSGGSTMDRFSTIVEVAMMSGELSDRDGEPMCFIRKVQPHRVHGISQRAEYALWHTGLYEALSRRNRGLPEIGVLTNELEALPGYTGKRRVRWDKNSLKTCMMFTFNADLPSWLTSNAVTVDEHGIEVKDDWKEATFTPDRRIKDIKDDTPSSDELF